MTPRVLVNSYRRNSWVARRRRPTLSYRHFGRRCCLHVQGNEWNIQNIEAANCTETVVIILRIHTASHRRRPATFTNTSVSPRRASASPDACSVTCCDAVVQTSHTPIKQTERIHHRPSLEPSVSGVNEYSHWGII